VFYYSKDSGSYGSPFGDYMYRCYGLPKDALGEQEIIDMAKSFKKIGN
jgi:hypothetical protein